MLSLHNAHVLSFSLKNIHMCGQAGRHGLIAVLDAVRECKGGTVHAFLDHVVRFAMDLTTRLKLASFLAVMIVPV